MIVSLKTMIISLHKKRFNLFDHGQFYKHKAGWMAMVTFKQSQYSYEEEVWTRVLKVLKVKTIEVFVNSLLVYEWRNGTIKSRMMWWVAYLASLMSNFTLFVFVVPSFSFCLFLFYTTTVSVMYLRLVRLVLV